jgi:bifunctional non-homologous end joining protein LigD
MPDALKVYKAKRNFSVTSEPAEGGEPGKNGLSFVIQKHWASRLHYDFRLELDGTMKSWAVPKGPSYDTRDKRMAVHVEDHPISYNEFEGTIPEKEYGAGKVIIWDRGTWEPLEDPGAGYAKGSLKFTLHGHKMHGNWALVKIKGRGDEKQEPWLLIKEKDDHARPAEEFSVVDEMPDSVRDLPLPADAVKPAARAKKATAPKGKRGAMPAQAVRADLPDELSPELATLVDKPPTTPGDWIFEVKFDGYRMLARIEGKSVRLITRNGNDWTAKLQPLQKELIKLKLADGWYDGEIVVNDEQGRPNFGLLQQAFDGSNTAHIVYFIFDAPYLRGHDLREVPLDERRALLEAELEKKASDSVRFSAEFGTDPAQLIAAACRLGLEGVIGKRRDSRYVTRRSPDWIKLKCQQRQEFVIGGYTDPQGARTGIGSLILGYYDKDGVLQYAGNVGTGFNDATLRELSKKLAAIETDENPFPPKKVTGRTNHWVNPKLVAEVTFSEWTNTGSIRHPSFQGLRTDKPAKKITREVAKHMEEVEPKDATPAPATTLPASFKVTHGERVMDPQSGVTKLELVRYYALVGELMMEHLKGRPLALVRAPGGVGGELFFQKHADVRKLPGVVHMPEDLDPGNPPMLEIASVEGILSASQWNVVEFHTQNATRKRYEQPDRMVFDLDPGEGVEWKAMQEAAQLMHAFLDELGLPSFLKTSGGKGLHVMVPIKGTLGWDEVKGFSQAIVHHLAATLPDRFAFKSGARNRVGKIFID